jgi:hypothetical protein
LGLGLRVVESGGSVRGFNLLFFWRELSLFHVADGVATLEARRALRRGSALCCANPDVNALAMWYGRTRGRASRRTTIDDSERKR